MRNWMRRYDGDLMRRNWLCLVCFVCFVSYAGAAEAEPVPSATDATDAKDEAASNSAQPLESIGASFGVRACPAILRHFSTPSKLEVMPWLSVAGRVFDDNGLQTSASFGAGMEATGDLAELGRPSYGGPVVLRWGIFGQAETDLDNHFLGDGGLVFSAGQTEHAPFGSYTLRVGGGYGRQPGLDWGSHLTFTLTGGVHSLLDRYSEGGGCDRPPAAGEIGFGSVLRLFVTARTPVENFAQPSVTFGLEFSPGFLLPPYDVMRLAGARPSR